MRFSLRFLILLVALCGIGLGIYARERAMKMPRIIPVQYHTDRETIDTPETVVAYHNPRRAKAIRESSDEKHLTTPAARRKRAHKLAADLSEIKVHNYNMRDHENWEIVREHPDVFLPKLQNWLSSQSSMQDFEIGGKIALAIQDDAAIERANKEAVRRLKETPLEGATPVLRFLEQQKDDLQRIPGLAEAIVPFLQSSYGDRCTAHGFVFRLGAPESEMRKHLEILQREILPLPADADHSERRDHYLPLDLALAGLTNSPLVREEAAGDAFIYLVSSWWGPGGYGPELRMFKHHELPWKERAIAELCKYTMRPKFYRVVCEFGGAAQTDYYVARLTDSYRDPQPAFGALVRIWGRDRAVDALKQQYSGNPFGLLPILAEAIGDDAAPLIVAAIDAEDPENRLDAADVAGFLVRKKLCRNNKQILERLEKAFHDGLSDSDYLESKQLLNDMGRLGFQRCDELAVKLPHFDEPNEGTWRAKSHWIVNDISYRDFADYLDQLQFGPAVDVDRILRELRNPVWSKDIDRDWSKRIDPDRFARRALIQIGVALDSGTFPDPIMPADKIMLELSSITQGDFEPIGVIVDCADGGTNAPTVQISWNKIVFEASFVRAGYTFDVHEFVDALTAILDKYVESDKRFVVYPVGRTEPIVAYLDEQIVQDLSQRFGLVPLPVKAFPGKTP